jgi:hypothetical protein
MKQLGYILSGLLLLGISFAACDKDDEVVPFDAPTVAVTVDNSTPFPKDEIKFNVTANAKGGLKSISLNGNVIKTYSNKETSDQFEYKFLVPENATLGATNYEFRVEDVQSPSLSGKFTVTATVQNPDFRGNPVVLFNFNSTIPNTQVASLTFDSGPNSWEAAYALTTEVADPANGANKVLQANRLGAHEWYFQGGGALFVKFANSLNEDQVNGLVSGDRVLQMNMYFKEVPKIITAHKSPADPASTQAQFDASWRFDRTTRAWNFNSQDTLQKGISVAIEVGNAEAWAWNNGNPLGKKFFLVGSITEANKWQTVTFSRREKVVTGTGQFDFILNPLAQSSTAPAYLDDAAVTLDKINYLAVILNNRKTSQPNTDGWFEMPGDGNGNAPDRPVGISDDHNQYLIDNIRIIDADEYDKNPNDG